MSDNLSKVLQHNEAFVRGEKYLPYQCGKYPARNMLILTCMDTRLTELLPKAVGINGGDAKIIKNGGASLLSDKDDAVRGIIIAYYALRVTEIFVIGHKDCGMTKTTPESIKAKMIEKGITPQSFADYDCDYWLQGFIDEAENVRHSVSVLKHHPLLPPDTLVHGLLIDPHTGKLDVITS